MRVGFAPATVDGGGDVVDGVHGDGDGVAGQVPGRAMENLWDQVDDFDWLRREPSPHWRVLGAEERVRADVWRAVMSAGGQGVGVEGKLEEVLAAVGLVKR